MSPKDRIASRIAREIPSGSLVNLGIGLPSLVANFVSADENILFQSENGLIGLGGSATLGQHDPDLTNAGSQFVTLVSGAAAFDSAFSFGLIRGGHVDITVLGGLEVDERGLLANWVIPGQMVPGMGGAMDLAIGAKKVIVAMQHQAKGQSKLKKRCSLPLTSDRPVDLIVTDLAVFKVCDSGLELVEISEEIDIDQLAFQTEAKFEVSSNLSVMS